MMKLYPFVYGKDKKESLVCCFVSFVNYHGYALDKKYASLIFEKSDYQSLLNGLDIFNVVYEPLSIQSFKNYPISGVLVMVEGCYYLCCGCIFQHVVLMHPQKGYLFLTLHKFQTLVINYAVHLKFLGEYNYPKSIKHQYIFYIYDFLLCISTFLLVYFFPIQNLMIIPIAMMMLMLVQSKMYDYLKIKKEKTFENTLILDEARQQFDHKANLLVQRHLLLSLMLSMQMFLVGYVPFYRTYLLLFYTSAVVFHIFITKNESIKNTRLSLSYLLFVVLFIFGIHGLYLYVYQQLSLAMLLGLLLFMLMLGLLFQYINKTKQEHCLDILAYQRWEWFKNTDITTIESIAVNDWYFEESTVLYGSLANLDQLYHRLYSPLLFINQQPITNFIQLAYLSHLVFLDSFILDDCHHTLEELFINDLEFLSEALIMFHRFNDMLLLSQSYHHLDKERKELFGFLYYLCKEECFYVVKEAFTYQSSQNITSALLLLRQKAPKIRMILMVYDTKMMNHDNNYAIIRHEKVGV